MNEEATSQEQQANVVASVQEGTVQSEERQSCVPESSTPENPPASSAEVGTTATADAMLLREIVDPRELEEIVSQNPVLVDIRNAGASAKREEVYPTDSRVAYVYRYLENFPPNSYALPQSFRKIIKGLHAGHWLSKKIEEIKNRRWRSTETSLYGKLSVEEVAALQKCNKAFFELYINDKPPDDILKKRQEQYDKKKQALTAKKAENNSDPPVRNPSAVVSVSTAASAIKTETESLPTNNATGSTTVYRQVIDPQELEAIVQQNPVLRDIRTNGSQAKREDVYPADSTADYVFEFLKHFPPQAFALPQAFRRVIKGLHAGHWLSKKIEEIKNRRWRAHTLPDGGPAPYGKLSVEEAEKLQNCNRAFWETYVNIKPADDVLKKRQEQYEKKTAHNKNARALAEKRSAVAAAEALQQKEETGASMGEDMQIHTDTTGGVSNCEEASGSTAVMATSGVTQYTEIVDPTATGRLEEILQTNPVLLKIREYGPTAKREEVYPTSSTLEAEEYVYTYLRYFPENTFALPQVFRKVVKGLNSSHWLAKKVDELKNRRWRRVPLALYGRLSDDEVEKIRTANPAFWFCYLEKKPPEEVLLKKQAQYDKKTATVKQARTVRPMEGQVTPSKEGGSPKSPKLSKKTRIVSRANAAAASRSDTFEELQDPTAIEILEEIVQANPVLMKIRECGVKAKREDVYPTSTTLQAEEYVFTYLKHFPENTFALPPTFRKVVRGLNASHWLAKKIIEMKDRRWRLKEGQESEFGRMNLEEVEKIKMCNPAFWELYINREPPPDILSKKRKQYERKTEHNKNARATKKPKLEEIVDDGNVDDHARTAAANVPNTMDESEIRKNEDAEKTASNPSPDFPPDSAVGSVLDEEIVNV